ncbi:hypothetical protein [Aeromonas caviae]|uniref:hypothetical protein n=1 Tax=Aeromonas caviae TaxID=648 RepID=UPI0030DAD42A
MKAINILELQPGMVVNFYGAKFEIETTKIVRYENDDVMCALGRWLEGSIVPGYFGPNKGWNFQGNHHVTHYID